MKMASLQDCSKTDFSYFKSMPLDELLEEAASKETVPGGGGIAAMTAASAAAMNR